ncbi:histidine phosphatase family protein [Paenibacillus puerhi]|uniref:histidine phosphatase family protein n=1 Tax=Paenibacillus puerhi TaxID=2692622 RepID=UPI001914F345|nr:histidine phosphatase family protein [Paenibacillus puerhi]
MSKITTIYLVRHGQTEWNVEQRLQGHQDSPLTELGINQARWLGEALQNEPLDAIFASTSQRACRTAELIRGARDIAIIPNESLKEINMGVWEGRTQSEAKEQHAEQFDYFWNDPELFRVEGSETFGDVSQRGVDLLNQILVEWQGKSVLLVTHTVVVKLLMAYFEGRPLKQLWELPYIHPACLCKLEIHADRANILLHGDIGHYREASERRD